MTEKNYSKILTIILIIIVVAVLGLIAFLGFDMIKKHKTKKQAEEVVDAFYKSNLEDSDDEDSEKELGNVEQVLPMLNEAELETTTTSSGSKKVKYKGYNVVGTIEIPEIKLKYPILERVTKESIETSVAILQPSAGPNNIGNTTIVGHNYRNGSFFGNNDRLSINDKIYITDATGNTIKYNIYKIYTTTPEDAEYMTRNTNGKREISLSTCTDNSKERLVIWAVEE